jgi:outer membrane lipoprotein-sorting protein
LCYGLLTGIQCDKSGEENSMNFRGHHGRLETAKSLADDHRKSTKGNFTRCPSIFATKVVLLVLFCGALLDLPATAADQQRRLMSLLTQMESSYAGITDYVAVFHKQERVSGRLLPEETILLKFQKPLKVYMKWIKDPLEGTEALYAQGKNDNKVIAHRGGMLGLVTLSLDPTGSIAMEGNRHPITEAGFGHLIAEMHKDVKTAVAYDEIEIIRLDEEHFKGRPSIVVEAKFTPRAGRSYYASHSICHIDEELLLPIGAAFYDGKGLLFERYAYTDVKINVGLTPMDFSRRNPAYHF